VSGWTDDELRRVEDAQELDVAAVRRDGTVRAAVPIWVVRAGEDLYVRAASVPSSGWHREGRRGIPGVSAAMPRFARVPC
jgi:hypothetical protein